MRIEGKQVIVIGERDGEVAGRLAGDGVRPSHLLAAPFRTGGPWRLRAACGAATGSRDAGQGT